MARIQSIFGPYSEQLQVLVDSSLDKFSPVWFPKYFDWGTTQPTLTYVSVLGASRIEAAASIIARGSAAPLRARNILQKLSGEIPAISQKFKMEENDYRDFLYLQQLQNVDDITKRNQLMDLLFGDVKKAGDSSMKRVDFMCLQAVSTGTITIDITTNPDGRVVAAPIDLGMPSANKGDAVALWSDATNGKPVTDIQAAVQAAEAVGKTFSEILMSKAKWYQFMKCKEVIDSLTAFQGVVKGQVTVTLDKVNEYLTANFMPTITIVNEMIGVEKDGVIGTQKPWNDKNVAFIPSNRLGKIHNALAIEQLQPVGEVNYALYNRALISKWLENDPFLEFTKVELNAFPGLEMVNYIYLLSTTQEFGKVFG
jgi:hypothetical protein